MLNELLAAFTIGTGISQKKKAKKINPKDVTYEESPYAKEQLASARASLNARMPGAAQAERSIYQNQANTLADMGRNATDASQLLALAGGVQGQTNDAFGRLGVSEAQNQQVQRQNLNNALGVMTQEGDKVYSDKLRKYQEAVNAKNALMNAGMTNISNGMNNYVEGINQMGAQLLSFATGGMGGGMGGGGMMGGLMGGGGASNTMSSALYGQQQALGAAQPYALQQPTINYSLIGR